MGGSGAGVVWEGGGEKGEGERERRGRGGKRSNNRLARAVSTCLCNF